MSKREPKIIELPYMGPDTKDKGKDDEQKRYENTMPVTSGTRRTMPVPPHVRDRDYAKGGKVKKYADGGQIQGQVQQPTYPFYGNTPQAGGQNGGMNQTFNMQPQANADSSQQPQQRFKKGGAVKSASARADGCAIRGKTRA